MKTLLAVLGSTRPGSTSHQVANQVMAGAKSAGYQVVEYHINELDFKGCLGCGACRKMDRDCIQKDGLTPILSALHQADALLVSAPNYYAHVSGQMIAFLNRLYCMTRADHTNRLPAGKKLVTVFSQGAPEGYPKYQAHYEWYNQCLTSKGLELAGSLNVGGDSDLSPEGSLMQRAYRLGAEL